MFGKGGAQTDSGFGIILRDDAAAAVCVTGDNGNAACAYTKVGEVHAGGIAAALVDHLILERDIVVLAALFHRSGDLFITDNRRIGIFDGNAVSDGVASDQVARIIMGRRNTGTVVGADGFPVIESGSG